MKKLSIFALLGSLLLLLAACEDDPASPEMTTSNLNLQISGLEDLGNSALYEGWIMVDGAPQTTGTFSVDANGNMSSTSFEIDSDDLSNATAFILTIEPNPDPSPDPSDTHILAGDFSGSSASLSISHPAALGTDFSSSMGTYILATPTNGADTDEKSGIWFLDLSSGSPAVGLSLPTLPSGWKYEGWTVINGMPVTSGTFLSVTDFDDADPFSSTMAGPPFPGEDYLVNAPSGLTFPTDISGGMAVISVEPYPDNSTAPFTLKPLVGSIPSDAMDHTNYDMGLNASFPTGTATK
ncbi:MAG: hypothetical protein SCALA702_21850 [Melioribacteraceae bacterium]|nr:MAG: hypothetical protein SCALA702_21850 [Melioribacteraceae bacterium]